MSTDKERLQQLEESYRKLWDDHIALKEAIKENYAEFKEIRDRLGIQVIENKLVPRSDESVAAPSVAKPVSSESSAPVVEQRVARELPKAAEKSTWEQYIGEQLLSKIGIIILIIGVGIGAKYAIDHELLSPTMRIAGGYLVAAILGFFAFRFKDKYSSFSAVLVSGAMTVTYFMTYVAYTFYQLYPYSVAFVILLLTTVATVMSAIRFNQVVIAHIGLVGAYVLPALLAKESSHISSYLIYMAVINCGILVVSFLRDWKSLFHVAFSWTTLVFIVWFILSYKEVSDAPAAIAYLCLFFLLFQAVSLAYPLLKKQLFRGQDLFLIIPNMLSFFVMGQYVLKNGKFGDSADFIFGLLVSALFFTLWIVFRKIRPEDKLLQESHFIIGASALTFSFLMELDGANLPFILTVESCLLGWLALRSKWRFLDIFSTAITGVTGIVLLGELLLHKYNAVNSSPFLNTHFGLHIIGMLIAVGTFIFLFKQKSSEEPEHYSILDGLLLLSILGGYLVFASELIVLFNHWKAVDQLQWLELGMDKAIPEGEWNSGLIIALTALSGVYWFMIVSIDRMVMKFRNGESWMQPISVTLIGVMLLIITILSTGKFSEFGTNGSLSTTHSVARYLIFVSIIGIGFPWLRSRTKNQQFLTLIHLAILWMLSLEMTHWLSVNGNQNAHKLSLSILWGIYAIYILYLGISKAFTALRITAMIILGITLVKLFFYDITQLSTIAKTILFIALGGLLLVGAYFYQRFAKKEDQLNERVD